MSQEERRARAVEATRRWKARNPFLVKKQNERRVERVRRGLALLRGAPAEVRDEENEEASHPVGDKLLTSRVISAYHTGTEGKQGEVVQETHTETDDEAWEREHGNKQAPVVGAVKETPEGEVVYEGQIRALERLEEIMARRKRRDDGVEVEM